MADTPQTIPQPSEGFEIVAAIKMPTPLRAFTKFCKLAAKTWPDSRLLPMGRWTYIQAPIPK